MKKEVELKFPLSKKEKYVVMVAPSFVVDFSYPEIIVKLRRLGFDKVVELTFGAKMINRDYHKKLKDLKKGQMLIASVCPGVVDFVKREFPKLKDKLIKVDSPMVAMGKICKKIFPGYKVVFLSPCYFKKSEAMNSKFVDYVVCYNDLKKILENVKVGANSKDQFDKFYNDYTKIYPLAGGLSKTANLKNILFEKEVVVIDGIKNVKKFFESSDRMKGVKFADVNFCVGGCIGGPCISSKLPIFLRKRKVLKYKKKALREDIPEFKKGLISRAKGIKFSR